MGESKQISKEELILIVFKLFQKREKEQNLSTKFDKAIVILIPKSDKAERKENYRLISLMHSCRSPQTNSG